MGFIMLIPVQKNGKYLGMATQEQIDNNASLSVYVDKKEQKPSANEKSSDDGESKTESKKVAADPSKIKKK